MRHLVTVRRLAMVLVMVGVALLPGMARAEVESGPEVGTAVPALKVFVATGNGAGNEVDVVADRGAKPTIYVFIPHEKFDRPIARFLRGLEKSVKEAGDDVTMVTVFLTDDEAKTKEHLPRVQMSLQFTANAMAVFPSAKNGPDGWGVNTDAHLTAVIVQSGKVAAKFGYRSVNETAVPEVAAALKKATGK
jgi:hypothetical protein